MWLLTTYALYPLTDTKSSDLPNQGLSSTALWRHEDFSQRAFSRTTDLLMLGSFNLRCYKRNVGPFPKEGYVLETFLQKDPTLVVCLSSFKETYISWTVLSVPFLHSAVGYALHADQHG